MILSRPDIDQFIELGYVKVPEVFSAELAEEILAIVWKELNVDPKDPSTWPGPRLILKKVLEQSPVPRMISNRYVQALDDVCGPGRWSVTKGAGYWPILFPDFHAQPWKPPISGWHIDGDPFRKIDSADLGLVSLEIFSHISSGGGGTVIREGSHSYVAQLIARSDPRYQTHRELFSQLDADTNHLPVVEVTGKPGDLFFLHPFALHAESQNCNDQIRIIAVKLVRMNATMNLNRHRSEEYSAVELAILKSLRQYSRL